MIRDEDGGAGPEGPPVPSSQARRPSSAMRSLPWADLSPQVGSHSSKWPVPRPGPVPTAPEPSLSPWLTVPPGCSLRPSSSSRDGGSDPRLPACLGMVLDVVAGPQGSSPSPGGQFEWGKPLFPPLTWVATRPDTALWATILQKREGRGTGSLARGPEAAGTGRGFNSGLCAI